MSLAKPPPGYSPPTESVRSALVDIVGPGGVMDPELGAPLLRDWRGLIEGAAAMILAPDTPQRVAAVLGCCAEHGVAVTPQGGNTGLVGGATPLGPEILLSTKRLRQIRDVCAAGNTMTLEAGLTLAEAQDAATRSDRLFPLSIGAEGSAMLGGAISTNAGGVNVLRYGNMRDLVLGLEVALPDGRLWNGLRRLRKNNTGYDLKHLFIGGEGTLGIVTAAVLQLFPRPEQMTTAFVGVDSAEDAVALFHFMQERTGGGATSFELISRLALSLVLQNVAQTRDPFSDSHPWCCLTEFAAGGDAELRASVEKALADAMERGLVSNAVIAANERQREDFWRLRHAISEALSAVSMGVRHDVSVAVSDIPAFLKQAEANLRSAAPEARVAAFGHLGDGNIHYDVIGPEGAPKNALEERRAIIESAVYEAIDALDGSISAEHGVGLRRRDAIAHRKRGPELDMMRAVKRALDPKGIMNPGKMI